jgi:peptidase families S8 and S53 family protein
VRHGAVGQRKDIGLLDGPVNTNIPELQGANIRYMSRCDVESSESIPTRQDIADYVDGLVDPRRINATNAKKK